MTENLRKMTYSITIKTNIALPFSFQSDVWLVMALNSNAFAGESHDKRVAQND
jgi:hypothetical protein